MKNIFFLSAVHPVRNFSSWLLLTGSICVVLSAVISSFAQEKLNLAVAEFEARNVSQMDAVTISDFLRTELVKSGVFNVVERRNMEKILAEQRFQMSGCTTQECAVQMGRILNVQKIVIGSLAKLGIVYHITASITDVETTRVEISERITCVSEFDFPDRVRELARMLISRVIRREAFDRRQTFVTKIIDRDRKVIMNKGRRDGVKERDVYEITNGSKKVVAIVLVESVEWEESIARIVRTEGETEVGQGGIYRSHFQPIKGGFLIGVNDKRNSDIRQGIGAFYEYFTPSRLGIHLDLGVWGAVWESGPPDQYTYTIIYPFSLIFKYYTESVFSSFSPYGGIGLSSSWRILEPKSSSSKSEFNLTPVINLGIAFRLFQKTEFGFDWRKFAGQKFEGSDTNLSYFSFRINTSW